MIIGPELLPLYHATTLFFLGGEAKVRVYDSLNTLLFEILLADPAGEVVGTQLVLTPADGIGIAEGIADHADLVNGDGSVAYSLSVSLPDGDGEVKLSTLTVALGAVVGMTSAVIG